MPAQGFESEARAATELTLDPYAAAPPPLTPPPDFIPPDAPVGEGPRTPLETPVGLGPLKPPPLAFSRGDATRGDRALVPVAALEETRGFSLTLGVDPKKENRESASSSSLSFASF